MLARKEGQCKIFTLEGICSEQSPEITEEHLRLATEQLPSDAYRGDIVIFKELAGYRNEGIAIFNGEAVELLGDDAMVDDEGHIPKSYHVIEDDVPPKYWANAINHNCTIWFNHHLVKDQLINNLTCGTTPLGDSGIYTKFDYNNKTYYVVWEDSWGEAGELEKARRYIRNIEEIPFSYCHDHDDIIIFNIYYDKISPRAEGRCKSYTLTGIFDLPEYKDQYVEITEKHLKLATAKLTACARRGDIVVFEEISGYRNNGIAIFNGNEVENLECEYEEDGHVPKSYHVIEDNVPITYWVKDVHGYNVWFTHQLVIDQLTENLLYGDLQTRGKGIFTKFDYNNKTYYMVWDESFVDDQLEDDLVYREIQLEKAREYIEMTEEINFQYDDYDTEGYTLAFNIREDSDDDSDI